MTRTRGIVLLLVGVLLLASVQRADAGARTEVAVSAGSIRQVTAPAGACYFIPMEIPAGITSVRHAWMEVRVDVSPAEDASFQDPAPVFEVYALNQALNETLSSELFVTMRVPMSRPVATGWNRIVRIDVTEFVQRVLANPAMNHGLVVGAVTEASTGDFVLGTEGDGAVVSFSFEAEPVE